MKDDVKEFVEYLKSKDYSTDEILYFVSIRNEGEKMTQAIYKFNELYDNGEIDGFPESSIKVLEMFYGGRLKNMKTKTLEIKVQRLQGCLDSIIDYKNILESVEYYLGK